VTLAFIDMRYEASRMVQGVGIRADPCDAVCLRRRCRYNVGGSRKCKASQDADPHRPGRRPAQDPPIVAYDDSSLSVSGQFLVESNPAP
jgi:hypothetical protein